MSATAARSIYPPPPFKQVYIARTVLGFPHLDTEYKRGAASCASCRREYDRTEAPHCEDCYVSCYDCDAPLWVGKGTSRVADEPAEEDDRCMRDTLCESCRCERLDEQGVSVEDRNLDAEPDVHRWEEE